MSPRNYKKLGTEAVFGVEPIEAGEAAALATLPGGCEGKRYPLFLVGEAGLEPGTHAAFEFVLPNNPGRWRGAAEVVAAVAEGDHAGLAVELLGLVLVGGIEARGTADAEALEPQPFDASLLEIEPVDVQRMLGDLLGREVELELDCPLLAEIPGDAVVAVYRGDDRAPIFGAVLDKAGAARIGGSLTMLPVAEIEGAIAGPGTLAGEPLDNVSEVLNIMSALFHAAGSPHVVLAEVITGEALGRAPEADVAPVFSKPAFRLGVTIDVAEYGRGQVALFAV